MDKHELMNVLCDAAQALAQEDISQWDRWICYVLEVLQGSASKEEYDTFLYDVHTEIAARIGVGRW